MPRCLSRFPEWRVSSATTASHEASTSRARSVMSPRFPIGVATTNRGTLRPRVEGILEMRQRRPVGTVDHGDHVEPRRLGGAPPPPQGIPRRRDYTPLLALVERFLRAPERGSRARADFHEQQPLGPLRDQIGLPPPATAGAR